MAARLARRERVAATASDVAATSARSMLHLDPPPAQPRPQVSTTAAAATPGAILAATAVVNTGGVTGK
ncbi:hypothetical protein GCM10010413_08280 [Promicromonospora sukumoe]